LEGGLMSEKQILEQILGRYVSNILGSFNPTFRMFSSSVTNSIMDMLDPYLNAFTNSDTNKINTKAAEAYMKEETNKKIEEFMKKFREQSKDEL
jgi:hypothetical protein